MTNILEKNLRFTKRIRSSIANQFFIFHLNLHFIHRTYDRPESLLYYDPSKLPSSLPAYGTTVMLPIIPYGP